MLLRRNESYLIQLPTYPNQILTVTIEIVEIEATLRFSLPDIHVKAMRNCNEDWFFDVNRRMLIPEFEYIHRMHAKRQVSKCMAKIHPV